MSVPKQKLQVAHIEHLKQSGITDTALIERVGLFSATANELSGLFQRRSITTGGLVFPFPHISGFRRVRLDEPIIADANDGYRPAGVGVREIRYLTKKKQSNHLYLPLPDDELQADSHLVITEGEKKALALVQAGWPALGVAGVWAWRTKDGVCAEFNMLNLKRPVSIVFDSDASELGYVRSAMCALAAELGRRGAKVSMRVCSKKAVNE